MSLRKIKHLILPLFLLLLMVISTLLLANSLIQRSSVQKYLIERLSHIIGIEVQTKSILIDLWKGIGITAQNIRIGPDPDGNRIEASGMKVLLDIGELIRGRIVPLSIEFLRPKIELAQDIDFIDQSNGKDSVLKKIPFFWITRVQSISAEKGILHIREKGYSIEDLSLAIHKKDTDPLNFKVNSNGRLGYGDATIPFRLNGTITPSYRIGTDPSINLTIDANEIPLKLIPFPESIAMKNGKFKAKLDISWNMGRELKINGHLYLNSTSIALIKANRHKEIRLPELAIDFQSKIDSQVINIPSIKLKGLGLVLSGKLRCDLKDIKNPYLEINGTSGLMTIKTFDAFFPSHLLPLWYEEELMPILKNGDIRLNLFRIKGSFDQIRNIRLPQNHSVIEMNLECHNFDIWGKGIQIPFKEVSAIVSLKEGDFQVSDLKASFGDSKIHEACLEIMDVYTRSPYLETYIDGFFNIEELIQQKRMEIIPRDIIQKLDNIGTLTGNLECMTLISYDYKWGLPKILWGEFLFHECILDKDDLPSPISLENMEFHIDEENKNRFKGNGSWLNSPFKISGEFIISKKDIILERADISANADMKRIMPFFHESFALPTTFKAPLACQISARRGLNHYSVLGRVGLEGISLENENFTIDPQGKNDYLLFRINYTTPGDIDFITSFARIGNSYIVLSGPSSIKEDILSLDISFPDLSLEDLGCRLKKPGIPVKATLDGKLKMEIPASKKGEFKITGKIDGKKLSLDTGIFKSPLYDGNFRINIPGNQIYIDYFDFQIGRSRLSFSGSLKGWKGLMGNIYLESDFLDTADLIPLEYPSFLENGQGFKGKSLNNSDMDIVLNIREGYWRDLKWKSLWANLDLKAGKLQIKSSKIDLEHGSLDIKGHMYPGKEPDISFNGIVLLNNQPVDKLLKDIRSNYKGLKGNLDMAANLYVRGRHKEDLIPSLTGIAHISMQEGLIKNPNAFIKVLDALSLQNIFKERPPDLREDGLYFDAIKSDAEITKGILKSDNFVMKSPVLNAVAYGELDLDKKIADFTLATQPHGTIDTIIGGIPIIGFIIMGEDRSVIAYTFKVKGPISNPKVTFIPIESIGKGVAGILKRLLMTPIRVMKDLQGNTDKNQGDDLPESVRGGVMDNQ